MTKEELRDRFYVETGILDPFERVEEYMSWLEDNVIELSKLNQPAVMSEVCDCNLQHRKAFENNLNECRICSKKIKQTDV